MNLQINNEREVLTGLANGEKLRFATVANAGHGFGDTYVARGRGVINSGFSIEYEKYNTNNEKENDEEKKDESKELNNNEESDNENEEKNNNDQAEENDEEHKENLQKTVEIEANVQTEEIKDITADDVENKMKEEE